MEQSKVCFRCEKKYKQQDMVRSGGCDLCIWCFEYIEKEWDKEMAKEVIHERILVK